MVSLQIHLSAAVILPVLSTATSIDLRAWTRLLEMVPEGGDAPQASAAIAGPIANAVLRRAVVDVLVGSPANRAAAAAAAAEQEGTRAAAEQARAEWDYCWDRHGWRRFGGPAVVDMLE